MAIDQFAVSEFSTLKWSFEEDVQRLCSLGLNGIGVWRHKLEDYGEEKGAELLIDAGLPVSSLQWAGEFTGAGMLTFKEAVEDTLTAIYQAALIGADCLIVHPGSRNNHASTHAARLIRAALSEAIPVARDYGVTLALEPMHRVHGRDWSFLHQIDNILELIEEFGSRNLGIVFDTFQMATDTDCIEILHSCMEHICLVQVADCSQDSGLADRLIPGDGALPIREILSELSEFGYNGFYELEVFGPAVEYRGYENVIQRSVEAVAEISQGIKTSQSASRIKRGDSVF